MASVCRNGGAGCAGNPPLPVYPCEPSIDLMAPNYPRIIHITTAHPRDDVRIMAKFAKYWTALGPAELIVCDGLPNETVDGVLIHGLAKQSSRLARMLRAPFDCLRFLRRNKKQCVVHLHDPELLIVALFMRWSGYTVVFDLHEDLIDQVISKPYLKPQLSKLIYLATRSIYPLLLRTANAHIAATSAISERYGRYLGRNIPVIQNYVMRSETRDPQGYAPKTKTLVYSGAINEIRGIWRMLAIGEALPEGWRLVICGRFRTEALQEKCENHPGWKNIDYRGHVTRSEVRQIYAEAACGLVLFDKQPNHMESLPNKMFEYMGNALPCVATDIPHWQQLVEVNEVGICVPSEDNIAMLHSISMYLFDPEKRARHAENGAYLVQRKYTWEPEFNKYAELILSLQIRYIETSCSGLSSWQK